MEWIEPNPTQRVTHHICENGGPFIIIIIIIRPYDLTDTVFLKLPHPFNVSAIIKFPNQNFISNITVDVNHFLSA